MKKRLLSRIARSIIVFLLAILCVANAHAGGGTQGSGGNVGGGCSTGIFGYSSSVYGYCSNSGFGWVYYEYLNDYKGELPYFMSTANAGGVTTIDAECTEYGGFWHFGFWAIKFGAAGSSGGYSVSYNGLANGGNPPHGRWAGTNENNGLQYASQYNVNGAVVFYKGSNRIAKSVKVASDSEVRGYYDEFLAVSGRPDIWDGSLSYFCYGEGMSKTTFNGWVSNAKFSDENSTNVSLSNYSTRRVIGNSANLLFTNKMQRNNDGKSSPATGFWTSYIDNRNGSSGSSSFNQGQTKTVQNRPATVSILPGQSKSVTERLNYSSEVNGNNQATSWADAYYTVNLYRNQATASGKVDASVATGGTTATNPNQTIYTSDGNYTVKFQHTLTRGRDGAGGTVGFSYSTSVSGTSNRGSINAGSAKSGTSSAIREGGSSVVVSYNNQTINGTLYPDETHTICQTLTYQSVVNVNGNRNSTARRCVTIRRTKATCPINNSEYGVINGNNVTKLTLYRRKASNISNNVTQSIINQGEINIWAMPTDMIRYQYDTCLGGQLRSDYYNGSRAPKSKYTFSGNNTSASGNNRYKYLFGNQLGNGTRSSYILNLGGHTSYSDSNYNKTYYSPSVNNNALACTSTSTGSYYQIPGSAYNCRSATYVGRNSDAGSVISQTLTYPVAPNSSTRTLVGNVKIPYNYDLVTTPLDSNPGNTPINAGTSINVGFKIDVTSRCNVQVQGNCNSADKTYKTDPKTTQYRIYYWTVGGNTTENELKRNIGTEIKDKDNNVIGYYLPNDPKRLGYSIAKEGTDLFAESNDTATVSGANINIPANAEIGTKICTAVAVWPADSHDLPGANVINDGDQSVALKDASNLRQWRSSNPSCYTVGKKPTIAIKGAGVYAQNGIETATSKRTIDNSGQKIYGSWSEYTAISAKSIIGFSTGAGLWGGKSLSGSGNLTCRFSAMTLANENCSTGTAAEALGNVVLTDSTSSSPKNIAAQMKTRYTKNGTTGLATGTNVLKVNEFINNSCTYDADSGIFKKQGASGDTYECLANGAAYVYSAGTLTINPDSFSSSAYAATNSWRIPATDSNHTSTYVIHARDIVINSNIIYGSSADRTAYGHDRTVFKIGDSLPQVILIAENSIQIGAQAYNIDAWLIAPNIDTCSHDYNGAKFSNTGTTRISANTCNRQLKINGPVLTRNLALNRTHGSGGSSVIINKNNSGFSAQPHGNASAKAMASPAEIFNISPDVYIWAAGQSTRLSQAITTYQRELPARF